MPIQVTSEIAPLEQVLLHRPGSELEQLVPEVLEQLLFDDIPYLKAAQREHDTFAALLQNQGARVVYLEDLAAEALRQGTGARELFIDTLIEEAGAVARHYRREIRAILDSCADERALVLKTMAGITGAELPPGATGPLVSRSHHRLRFVLEPMPNLYFTRDPFATIGRGVSMNHMYSHTRRRETIYGRTILRHHPAYAGKVPLYYHHDAPFSIEGGDILNLSRRVLAVGLSQRTTAGAVELLAQNLFTGGDSDICTILAMDIPNLRAYMHLDTVFTQVDADKFTIHPGILDALGMYLLQKTGDGRFEVKPCTDSLQQVLKGLLGLDHPPALIPCGGVDSIAAAREQWNDGANTLCLAPGVVAVYDRNAITNRILTSMGVTVLEIPGSELSRGRGGPRCMSMPLRRAAG